MVPSAEDAATLTYNTNGVIVVAPNTFAVPLFSTTGSPQSNKAPGLTDGLITPIPSFSFGALSANGAVVPNGVYKIGFACYSSGATAKFWQTSITVSNSVTAGGVTTFNWARGTVPAAPVLASPPSQGNGTLAGTFTQGASTPAATGFTVAAVPTSGPTVTQGLAARSTSFSLSGLVNDMTYAVTVTATNSVGTSPASNTVNGTPGTVPAAPVLNAPLVISNGSLAGTFTAAASTPPITGFTAIATPPTGPAVTLGVAAGATSFTVSGLINGTQYAVTITAANSVGNSLPWNTVTGTPGTVPAAPVLAAPLTAGNGTLSGSFTAAASAPATTAFTLTAVPTSGATVTLALAAGTTAFTLTGLTNDTSYSVSVKATNSLGDSVASNTVIGTPVSGALPSAPLLANPLTPSAGALSGMFTPVPSVPATSAFTVTAVPATGATVTKILAANATTFTLTGLVNGRQYAVTVAATNSLGTGHASNSLSGTPGSAPPAPALVSPLMPGDSSMSGRFTAAVSTPPTLAYVVTAVPTSGDAVALQLAADASTFSITGLVNGTQYALSVRGVNALGTGPASNIVQAVAGVPPSVPVAPVIGAPLLAGNCTLTGTFTAAGSVPETTGFTVTARPSSGPVVTVSLPTGATDFTVVGLTNGLRYTVTMKAKNGLGPSAASNAVEGVPTPPPFVPFTPRRLLDTRAGYPTTDGVSSGIGRRDAGSVTEVQVAGRSGVPADASAVVLNVTVTGPEKAGYATVFPCGSTQPTASSLNFSAGATVANAVISKLGDRRICIYTQAATDLVIDANGFFPAGAAFNAFSPARVFESRPGLTTVDGLANGGGLRAAGSVTEVQITGRAGIPSNATAVVLNVTVTDPKAAGYITVFPCGATRPLASNVNFVAGSTVANAAVTKLGTSGKVCAYTLVETNVVIDVTGFMPTGSSYTPLTPARVLETRAGSATIDGQANAIGRRTADGGRRTV